MEVFIIVEHCVLQASLLLVLPRHPVRGHAPLGAGGQEVLGAAAQVAEGVRRAQPQLLPRGVRGAGAQLVEDVVVALLLVLVHHARALQQVVADVAARHRALAVEVDLDELAEARGVVVPRGFRVPERLQNRICVEDLSLESAGSLAKVAAEVVENILSNKSQHHLNQNCVSLS